MVAVSTLFLLSLPVAHAADLRVDVEGVTHASGTLNAVLINSEAAWNGKAKPADVRRVEVSTTAPMQLVFKDLAPGTYAVRLVHDENGNGKLDTNMVGMPTEGYGFSNNPRVMRAATFAEASFQLPADGTTINVVLR
ncbi:MAG: DUF2141 domain-containing protein [Rhodanobacter sp.]